MTAACGQVRLAAAPALAPDALMDVYAAQRWAREALAKLDAGEQIPLPPAGIGE